MTQAAQLASYGSNNVGLSFKNRIINGAMMIDQRNAGASVTPANVQYTLDRWSTQTTQTGKFTVQQNAGAVTPPSGYKNYLGVTSTSAYSVAAGDAIGIMQMIEGYNVADLGFGAAGASTVTLSFWVRSSLTGAFGGSLNNNGRSRSYPFSFTINSTNTWQYVTITIAGDTAGTWLTNNNIGIEVFFNLGTGSTYSGTAGAWNGSTQISPTGATSVVGTNGATFYITGVQLEKGSTATSFDYRPYGTELALCQRYCYMHRASDAGLYTRYAVGLAYSSTSANCMMYLPVQMRAQPSATTTGTASNYAMNYNADAFTACNALPSIQTNQTYGSIVTLYCQVASGMTGGSAALLTSNANTTSYILLTAEL